MWKLLLSKGLLMKYIYQVIYYGHNSLFCSYELENELFSTIKKAKVFLRKIVDEEDRLKSDDDFYFYKIKIIKKELNILEEDKESIEHIYDLKGKELFCSSLDYKLSTNKIMNHYKNGTLVEIAPFPWNLYSSVDIPIYGIIGGVHNNEYIIYTIDVFKIIHLHVNKNSISLPHKLLFKNKNLLKLSTYLTSDIIDEDKIPKYSYEL